MLSLLKIPQVLAANCLNGLQMSVCSTESVRFPSASEYPKLNVLMIKYVILWEKFLELIIFNLPEMFNIW